MATIFGKYHDRGDWAYDGPGLDERCAYVGPNDFRIGLAQDQADRLVDPLFGVPAWAVPGDMNVMFSRMVRSTSERLKWQWRRRRAGLNYEPPEDIRDGTRSWF